MFRFYLSSLRYTMIFMISFGLFIGLVFPFYSAIFFGKSAFNPLYIAGCLLAGLIVGTFCSFVIKQALKFQLQRQFETLSSLYLDEDLSDIREVGDELESLQACQDRVINRVITMVANVTATTEECIPKHKKLKETSIEIMDGNEHQRTKETENLDAVARMNEFFCSLLTDIEEMTERSDERSDIASQMNETTASITGTIQCYTEAVISTSSSIGEMAASIKEISNNVDALSTSAEQTSSSIQQISTATSNVRDNTQKAVESSVNVRMLAQDGMRAMTATLKAMKEIEQSNEESYEAITRLSFHSARVGEFVKMIQEVVEQTTLLSLNASIIAAQAGERGKAFAVVAEEVRSLAHRTASSATEIQDLVKNIQKETAAVQRAIAQGKDRGKGGVKISTIASDALAKIEGTSTEVAQMIQKIAATTVKQAAGSRVINDEAAKNLETIRHITRSIKEQELNTMMVVSTLEEMRSLSEKITSSTQEQSQSNHQFLQSVIEENEKMKRLRDSSLQQLRLAEILKACIGESGQLMQNNVTNARLIVHQIENIMLDTQQLHQQIMPIRGRQ